MESQIEIVSSIEQAGVSGAEWNQLAARNETSTVFQTYEWFSSWWKVFGAQNTLFLVKAYSSGELCAIAPLMISRADGVRTLRFVGDEKADYCDFLIRGQKELSLKRIFDELTARRDAWDVILLRNIPEASSTKDILKNLNAGSGLNIIARQIVCPALVIRGHEEEAAITLRKETFRRRHNYFIKRGALEFRNIMDQAEALGCLDAFFDQHVNRRSAVGERSLFADPCNRDFYACLTKSMLAKGWLLFSVLEFNGKKIAFHFGFDYGSKVIWYKPSFDIEFHRHSPGKVLLRYLIKYAIENGRDEFDFTLGDEEFKRRFANRIRRNFQLEFYKSKSRYLYELSKNALRSTIARTMQGPM